jgi:hypothetical protein
MIWLIIKTQRHWQYFVRESIIKQSLYTPPQINANPISRNRHKNKNTACKPPSHESPRQYQKKTDKMKAKKDIENWKNQDN